MGAAWALHAMCESALKFPISNGKCVIEKVKAGSITSETYARECTYFRIDIGVKQPLF